MTTINLPAPKAVLNATVKKAVQEIVAAIITTLLAPRCVVVQNMNAITQNPWSLTETFIQNESDGEENFEYELQ